MKNKTIKYVVAKLPRYIKTDYVARRLIYTHHEGKQLIMNIQSAMPYYYTVTMLYPPTKTYYTFTIPKRAVKEATPKQIFENEFKRKVDVL
jgi:hypothetical protein